MRCAQTCCELDTNISAVDQNKHSNSNKECFGSVLLKHYYCIERVNGVLAQGGSQHVQNYNSPCLHCLPLILK